MFNEDARVRRAVQNFLPYGRVLVVDNHSTDRTAEVARELGADVLMYKNAGWVEDEQTTSLIKETVQTPWIYWGFSDEIVDRPTMDQMLSAIDSGKYSIINIARKNYYYGKFIGDAYLNTQNRAFKKDAIDFRGNTIHHFGKPTVAAELIKLLDTSKYFVHHFISHSARSYLRTLDGYTEVEAARAAPKTSAKLLAHMLRSFIGNYVIRRGYRAGLPGLFFSLQVIYNEALVNMKSYEKRENLDFAAIETKNNLVRDQLLSALR